MGLFELTILSDQMEARRSIKQYLPLIRLKSSSQVMRVISWLWDICCDTLALYFIIYVHRIFWKGARWDLACAIYQAYLSPAAKERERERERLDLVFYKICHYKGGISPPSSDCYLVWDRNRILYEVLSSSCGGTSNEAACSKDRSSRKDALETH